MVVMLWVECGLTNQAHPQPVAAVVERRKDKQNEWIVKSECVPAVGCSALVRLHISQSE